MPFINGGHIWLVLILLAVLVIFGPSKLPELGSAVGRSLREFKKATNDLKAEISSSSSSSSEAPAESAPASPAGAPDSVVEQPARVHSVPTGPAGAGAPRS